MYHVFHIQLKYKEADFVCNVAMAQHKGPGIGRTHQSSRTQHVSQLELAEALRSWAVDEMRFRPQGRHIRAPLPTTEDFAV